MMFKEVSMLLLALTTVFAAPSPSYHDNEIITEKRAALVLDRLLVALQKALHESDGPRRNLRPGRDEPRIEPLRAISDETNDMMAPQRRDGEGRGRVLKCYFNVITCF